VVGGDVLERAGHGNFYLVAHVDGRIAGYAGLSVADTEAWVQNIAVRRNLQRHGIGRRLLEALLTEATRRGTSTVLLEVAVDNAPAQRLYAEYGFETVGVRRGVLPADQHGRTGDEARMIDLPLVLASRRPATRRGLGSSGGIRWLADAVASSVDEHARFGGVVPEVASRAHLEAMVPTMHRALSRRGRDTVRCGRP